MMTTPQAPPRLAWGLTGAGHFLDESLELLLAAPTADVFLSRAAEEVVAAYGWRDRLRNSGHRLIRDVQASAMPVTKLYTNNYDLIVIAPLTGNSAAKMAHGIADNLVSNLFAHGGKCGLPILLLPCDNLEEIESRVPSGQKVTVYLRGIDQRNIEELWDFDGVSIAENPAELASLLRGHGVAL